MNELDVYKNIINNITGAYNFYFIVFIYCFALGLRPVSWFLLETVHESLHSKLKTHASRQFESPNPLGNIT